MWKTLEMYGNCYRRYWNMVEYRPELDGKDQKHIEPTSYHTVLGSVNPYSYPCHHMQPHDLWCWRGAMSFYQHTLFCHVGWSWGQIKEGQLAKEVLFGMMHVHDTHAHAFNAHMHTHAGLFALPRNVHPTHTHWHTCGTQHNLGMIDMHPFFHCACALFLPFSLLFT